VRRRVSQVETVRAIPFATPVLGFWAFAYNIIRRFATVGEYDVTERHFGALGFFLALTVLSLLLANRFYDTTFLTGGAAWLVRGRGAFTRRSRSSLPFSRLCTERCTSSERCSAADGTTRDRSSPSDRRRSHPTGVVVLAVVVSWLHRRLVWGLVLLAASAICLSSGTERAEMRVERTRCTRGTSWRSARSRGGSPSRCRPRASDPGPPARCGERRPSASASEFICLVVVGMLHHASFPSAINRQYDPLDWHV